MVSDKLLRAHHMQTGKIRQRELVRCASTYHTLDAYIYGTFRLSGPSHFNLHTPDLSIWMGHLVAADHTSLIYPIAGVVESSLCDTEIHRCHS